MPNARPEILSQYLTLEATPAFMLKYAGREFDQKFLDLAGIRKVNSVVEWDEEEGRIVLDVEWKRLPGAPQETA